VTLNSLADALTGLQANQTYMDVIGNNIANVNTVSYKTEDIHFADLLNQTVADATVASGGLEGSNGMQLGAGVGSGGINMLNTQGSVENTGRTSDMSIQGSGYFVLSNGSPETYYTRDGSFNVAPDGTLEEGSTGMVVMGWTQKNATTGQIDTTTALKALKLPINSQNAAATTSVSLAGNVDASQLVDPSPDPTTTPAVGGNYNTSITVYDSLGTAHQLTLNLQKTAADTWTATLLPTGDPLDDLGNGAGSASPSVTLQFNSDGSLLNVNGNTSPLTIPLTFNPDATNANPAQGQTINIDVSKLTQIANSSSVSVDTSDGSPGGTLSTFSVGQDGTMTAVYSNGTTKSVGQIAMTDFRNPDGLQRAGNNLYTVGNNSGNPQYTVPGTGTLGTIATGQLEGSNVDLAVQLAQMIQAQQGYNANTKVVSTTDAMLQALMTTVQ